MPELASHFRALLAPSKEGKKESKSKGNYAPPEIILDEVRMGFVMLDDKAAGAPGVAGETFIARENLEGLDIQEGTKVHLFRPNNQGTVLTVTVKDYKNLKRHVVLLSRKDLESLSVAPSARRGHDARRGERDGTKRDGCCGFDSRRLRFFGTSLQMVSGFLHTCCTYVAWGRKGPVDNPDRLSARVRAQVA